ncbi:MAG TPA: hypothetical protein VLL72_00355 [Kiloniellales bacterium]|nr:hypothetical protein [Kiloniellales bacterium]
MPDSTGKPLAQRIKRIGHLDLPGAGQIEVQGPYAYVGHMDRPHGTSILDVSDPKSPKVVSTIDPPPYSHTHKVRIAGDLMFTNVEQDKRHFLRRGEALPQVRADFEREHGRAPNDAEAAEIIGVKASDIPVLDAARERGYDGGGWRLWDVSDRSAPKLLSYTRTHGFGTHRFDADENYAYISTEMEGYVGNILVIYDVSDPTRPEEVSRWWMPGQHLAGGETPTWKGYGNRLHHALRFGDELWAAVWKAGFRVIDISDIAKPRTVGEINYHPPVIEPSHTIMPLAERVDGRRIAVGVDEEHVHQHGQPHAGLWVFDVTELKDIRALSSFHVSEMESPWSRTPGGRFGAHQFHEKPHGTLVFATWFAGGLRVVDVADPFLPKEVAYYIPEPCAGFPSPQSNDVFVDPQGLIYLVDRNAGLDILEFDGAP